MNQLKTELENYKKWAATQSWSKAEDNKECVVIREAPSAKEMEIVAEKFGKLPSSYLETLSLFGLSEFICDGYKTKMLSPAKIIELYDVVQGEMDFYEDYGIRELVLEEDGLDFSRDIHVMAGDGLDGCWALLNVGENSNGEILYWDTDQSGYVGDIFPNLEAFILEAIARAKLNNPLRLT